MDHEPISTSVDRWELSEGDSRFVLDLLMQQRSTEALRDLLAETDPARLPQE